jgi:hypothetical protein
VRQWSGIFDVGDRLANGDAFDAGDRNDVAEFGLSDVRPLRPENENSLVIRVV